MDEQHDKLCQTSETPDITALAKLSALEIEILKTKELWLREEVRRGRDIMMNLLRWGVTVLTGAEAGLFILRRHLQTSGVVDCTKPFPFNRWIVGTCMLAFLATFFCVLLTYTQQTHVNYRKQLVALDPSYSGIKERAVGNRWLPRITRWLLFAFPIADLCLWLYFMALKEWKWTFTLSW